MKAEQSARLDAAAPWLLAVVWLAAVALARPLGEFPVFDDWVYAHSAFRLARDRLVDVPEWTSALPLAQAAWGALFVKIGGASHAALRVATLAAAVIGTLCWQRVLRRLGVERRAAAWVLAVGLFNPAFFVLAPTFMTDVGFVAAWQLALLAGVAWSRERRPAGMLAATVAALIAAWVRQPGAALLVGLCAAAWSGRRRAQALMPLSAILVVLATQAWFGAHFGEELPLTRRAADLLLVLRVGPGFYLEGATVALAFVGLAIAPAAIATRRTMPATAGAVLGALALAWACWGAPVLRTGTVWGACELGGARSLLAGAPPDCAWETSARVVALLLASVGLAALLSAAAPALRVALATALDRSPAGSERAAVAAFLVVSHTTLAAGLLILWLFADRYWLLAATLAPALLPFGEVRRPRLAAAVLAVYALVAVAGTRDVFRFYDEANALVDELVAQGVPVDNIDAGYAINAWRRYLPREPARSGEGRNGDVPWVSAVTASPVTIANRLERGWVPADDLLGRAANDGRARRTLVVTRPGP